jgi:hypothetical protein
MNPVTGQILPGAQRGFGFFSRETDYGSKQPDHQQCTWYDVYHEKLDGWMTTGRFFAIVSTVLAIIGFVVMWMTCCVEFSRSMFTTWLLGVYISAAISVVLSFLIFGSEACHENHCQVASGCGYAMWAVIFHLISAMTVKSFPMAHAPNH